MREPAAAGECRSKTNSDWAKLAVGVTWSITECVLWTMGVVKTGEAILMARSCSLDSRQAAASSVRAAVKPQGQ